MAGPVLAIFSPKVRPLVLPYPSFIKTFAHAQTPPFLLLAFANVWHKFVAIWCILGTLTAPLHLGQCMMAGKPHSPRNYLLAGGISRYSRSAMYKKAAIYKRKRIVKEPSKSKKQHYKTAQVKGEKNGDKRVILLRKSVRWGEGRIVIYYQCCSVLLYQMKVKWGHSDMHHSHTVYMKGVELLTILP